jgi:DNA-binding NarL/FixJ family response regulator
MSPIRVLLVDDSNEFLQAAAHFLSSDPRIEVIGQFQAAEEAIGQVEMLHPDLVLMDITMPEMNGLEATRIIKEHKQPPRVIILTMYNDGEYHNASEAVNADAFVTKSEIGAVLVPLILSMFAERFNRKKGEKEARN